MLPNLPIILTGSFKAAAVTIDAHTVAAPPMSALIASIEEDGFREIPPLPAKREKDEVKQELQYEEEKRSSQSDTSNELKVQYVCSPVKCDALPH